MYSDSDFFDSGFCVFPGQDKWLQLDRALSPVAEHLEAQGFLARRPGSGSDSAARAREHSA